MFRVFTALSIIYTSRLVHNNLRNLLLLNNLEVLPLVENKINEPNQINHYDDIENILRINFILQ